MESKVKQFVKKAIIFSTVVAMTLSLVGCGKGNGGADVGDRTVIYYAASYVNAQIRDAYLEMVKTYNETQGAKDGIYVQMTDSAAGISGLNSALRSDYMYDVVQLLDDQYKTLIMQNGDYFVTMDDYLTDDVKSSLGWNDIPENLINRFRMNTTANEKGLFVAGEGTELLALPNGSDPHILFYNRGIFESAGINLIAVPETELDTYNKENNSSLKPHGYAEYKEEPFAGAKSGKNEAGEFVYKVFNECIPMNWEEFRCVASAMQNQYEYEYGAMTEWWFSYGWSVGGDCVGWDENAGQYLFTLTDKQPNYIALDTIEVNGASYAKGDILNYGDKVYLNTNASAKDSLQGKIYNMPSQYDAVLEYNRLGVPTDKDADNGIKGYGVAPNTIANRSARFTSGKDCPMLVESFSNAVSYKNTLGENLGMTMPAQYREYVGGSTYSKDGKDYLKVIGESYDGTVYTGDLHVENGTPIVGRTTSASAATGFFIPKNTVNKKYDEAFKFISWAAGPEGQKILSKGNFYVPNQTSYGLGEYAKDAERPVPNMWAGAYQAQQADIGDYTYFTTNTWITEWSTAFNSTVREGNMTLSAFMDAKKAVADTSLKGIRIQINGR